VGPKTQDALGIYDNHKNVFGYSGLNLTEAANAGGFWSILSPLETLLKWIMNFFYMLIPNYGVSIILLTILVRLLLFPLTKKSTEGTVRMQTMQPKVKELQDKYKDTREKMNTELMALYKKEGYNPASGCLPLLIQFPIFIAMYNLFNNHFELRGAMFIPGWIPDLSVPDTVLHFGFAIPFLGWTDLHILPFIYVASQLLYAKLTQTPDMKTNPTMKIMLYVMPIIFFFVLYNTPAGLLVYWIMSNLLAPVQTIYLNRAMKKKKAEMEAQAAKTPQKKVIVPPKAKKRK
jgi:YidC/Oxa1 family membrane protein insertase